MATQEERGRGTGARNSGATFLYPGRMPMCDMWEKHEQGHLIPPYSIVYNVDGEDDRPLTEVRRLVLTQYHRARAAGNTAWIVGMQMACLSSGAFPYEWILTYIPAEHDSENIKESWPNKGRACPGVLAEVPRRRGGSACRHSGENPPVRFSASPRNHKKRRHQRCRERRREHLEGAAAGGPPRNHKKRSGPPVKPTSSGAEARALGRGSFQCCGSPGLPPPRAPPQRAQPLTVFGNA